MSNIWKIKTEIRYIIYKYLESKIDTDEYNAICNNITNDVYQKIDELIEKDYLLINGNMRIHQVILSNFNEEEY